jgi:hypothetical protein
VFSAVPKESILKVSVVEADIEQPGLGLSIEDRQFLLKSQVSIVFHVAASVRFNEPLNAAMKTNTFAVLGMLQLCNELPQIKVSKAVLICILLIFVADGYFQTSLASMLIFANNFKFLQI